MRVLPSSGHHALCSVGTTSCTLTDYPDREHRILDRPVASSPGAHMMLWAAAPGCVLDTNEAEAVPWLGGDRRLAGLSSASLPSSLARGKRLSEDQDWLDAQKPEMLCSGRGRTGDLARPLRDD